MNLCSMRHARQMFFRRFFLPLLCLAALAIGSVYADATDLDEDGIPDAIEVWLGLDATVNDAAKDPDDDGLTNREEYLAGTDPLHPDTDRDDWDDAIDEVPVSRAIFPWGEPRLTPDQELFYIWPTWVVGAFREGGTWSTNEPWGWIAETSEDSLVIALDRAWLSKDLWMAVSASNAVLGDLTASLCDTNLIALAPPIALAPALPPWLTNRLPLAAYPSATFIAIHATQGIGRVTLSMLYVDSDGDGLDDDQAVQLAANASTTSVPATVMVSGVVSYSGTQPGFVHVVAVTNASSWTSTWHTTLVNPGAFALGAIPVSATYWIRAYVDANENNSNDCWEARGVGLPAPLHLVCATNVTVTLTDPDSNADGLSDWGAMQVGLDPALSNACARFPFVELFETHTVHLGDIHGQHGWVASVTNTAWVQSNRVYAGQQALMLDAPASTATVYQVFAGDAAPIVWTDLRMIAQLGCPGATNTTDAACGFFFDESGRLVVLDGLQPAGRKWVTLTNHPPVSAGEWVRISICLNFAEQRWLIGLNGSKVAENLGFGIPCDQLHILSMKGERGVMDNLSVSTNQPANLSLDNDALLDTWELQYFGNLAQAESGDPDADGLTNLQEYQIGTNPANPDTDADTLPDGWEVARALNPLAAADAALDADVDGLSNLSEYAQNTNPFLADTDGDTLSDGYEVNTLHTSPLLADSDGDGYSDVIEIARSTDPSNPASFPASEWQNHLKLILRNGTLASNLTDVPVLVRLTPERIDYSRCASDGRDLYFTDATGLPLAFELEQWNPAGETLCWVRLPSISPTNSANHFWLHVGNPAALSASTPAAVWNANYVGVWHLTETNNLLADSTLGASAAANVGAVCASGILGNARNFRGSDYLTVPPAALAAISNAVTVSLWTYGADSLPANTVCFYGSSAVGRELNAHIPWSDGNVYWDAFGNCDRISKAATDPLYKGAWTHWAFSKDATTGVMAVYCNGELWHSGTGKTRAANPINAFRIGMSTDGWCGYQGRMDELRVETVARSAEWTRFQYRSMRDQVLIYGDDQVVSLVNTVNGAEEGSLPAVFTVSRMGLNTNLPLSVQLSIPLGTATAGVDYAVLPRTVTIPAGAHATTLDVPVTDDFRVESTETVILSVTTGDYLISASNATATVAILDNDLDSDATGMSDAFQLTFFGHLGISPSADPDTDGLTNLQEYQRGTDPTNPDTDADGMPDGWELAHGLNPLSAADVTRDADSDDLSNRQEFLHGTDPNRTDSDGDDLSDGEEVNIFGLSPTSVDSNQNGLLDAYSKTTRRGVETSARTVDHITHDFTEFGDSLIWPNNATCSCSYDLMTDSSGLHLVEIAVENSASGNFSGYSFKFDVYMNGIDVGQISVPALANHAVATNHIITPWLAPANYNVRLVWVNRITWNGVVARPAIRSVRLLGIDNVSSTNHDEGIPDWMMLVLQGSNVDTDNDGLIDRDEVLTYHSNPMLVDTDNDGLSDAYEALTSYTNPNKADTDGDGVCDAAELQCTGTDPLTANFTNGWQTVATCKGNAFSASAGDWRRDQTNAVAFSRGWVEYEFMLPAAETCVLRLNAIHEWWNASCEAATPLSTSDILISVDGQFVNQYSLRAAPGSAGEINALLPHLNPGYHRVRLFWNAIDPRLHLRVQQVELGTFGGTDSDADGIKDWAAASARRVNGADRASVSSYVSPACIEGFARYPLLASSRSGTNSVPVLPGVTGRWYADLPLEPSGVPTPLAVSFENGVCVSNLVVTWTALDLLTAASNLNMRVGDTLQFTVLPPPGDSNGMATVTMDGGSSFSFVPGQSFTQRFDIATSHVFQATWTPDGGSATSCVVTIAVMAAPLPDAPSCMLGYSRVWTCPNVSSGVVLQTGPGASIVWNGTNATITVNRMNVEHYVVAHAGINGPILASRRITPFWIQAAVDSYLKVVEIRSTSEVWENRMVSLGIPRDVTIEISVIVAGITLDDLTLVRIVNSDQIGEAGDYTFHLIHPNSVATSVCHTIRAYQNGVFLGEAFYAQIGIPEDLR